MSICESDVCAYKWQCLTHEHRTEEVIEAYDVYSVAALSFSEDLQMHLAQASGDTCIHNVNKAVRILLHTLHTTDGQHSLHKGWD